MKKIIVLILAVLICFMFSACKDNTDTFNEDETNNELSSDESNVNNKYEESSYTGSMSLESFTSDYVEPKFKMVSKLSECYDYFETKSTDTVITEKNEDGTVKMITVKDKNGKVKADMKFTYDDKIVAAATFYVSGEKTERISFSFYDENTLNIAGYTDGESNMSIYFYNKDGTFSSYMDGNGLSTMLSGAIMEGIGNAFSQ